MIVERYKLEQPNLAESGIDENELIPKLVESEDFYRFYGASLYPKYLFWDKVRYLPRPNGWTAEEFWFLVKKMRQISSSSCKLPVQTESGENFVWLNLPTYQELLHHMDQDLGGILGSGRSISEQERNRLVLKGIQEEAIASSLLEGASTTRKAAQLLLREDRKPKTEADHMVMNNYRTMEAINKDYRKQKLDLQLLFQIHRDLTKNTAPEEEQNRFRRDSDEIVVTGKEYVMHVPPSEKFLKQEMERLIAYANDELHDTRFTHPIIKAIIIHFWIGYLHPFTDGNGRLARALFYWYALRKNYWVFRYLSLSTVIRQSPGKYQMAYVYSELDDNDLTYFIDYNLRKIQQAQREFEEYFERKKKQASQFPADISERKLLNARQIQLLIYLNTHPDSSTTYNIHANENSVTRLTAIKDLRRLEEIELLMSKKIGRTIHFFPTDKAAALFEN